MPRLTHEIIAIEQFLLIPSYRGQRNTERHASRVVNHLKEAPMETLLSVALIEFPGGRREIVDGNSRRNLWREDRLKKPHNVHATIFHIQSAEDAQPIYQSFNNPSSVKGARDEAVNAMRFHGWEPQSSHCRDATLKSPIMYAEGNRQGLAGALKGAVFEPMLEWLPELRTFDRILANGVDRGRTSTPIVAACLLSLRRHGDRVIPFWKEWFGEKPEGETINGPMNKLYNYVNELKRMKRTSGSQVMYQALETILYLVERWVRDGDATKVQQVRRLNLTKPVYCDPSRATPTVHEEKDHDPLGSVVLPLDIRQSF